MRPPLYMRSSSQDSLPIHVEESLQEAGLRRFPLCVLIVFLVIVSSLAALLLMLNIILMCTLHMNHHGMKFLKFYSSKNRNTGEDEKIVQFGGREIDLGQVVAASGNIGGNVDSDLNIFGSRVVIEGESNGTRLVLQDKGCKIEHVNDFQVIYSRNGRPLFSARHPLVPLDKNIKEISVHTLLTNKIRAPTTGKLDIITEDVSIRGNEGIRLEGRAIHFASGTALHFNTSMDGSIHMKGRVSLGNAGALPISDSPSLTASMPGYRLCICRDARLLFTVPGNKPCSADIC